MLHSKHILIPANTTSSNPKITRFKINKGVIYRVWVDFPPGCAGLVRLRMYHEGHPFLPVDKDAYITGDNFVFVYPVFYEVLEEPMIISVECWNLDDTYSHTIHVQLLVINKSWVMPIGAYEGVIAAFRSVFRR